MAEVHDDVCVEQVRTGMCVGPGFAEQLNLGERPAGPRSCFLHHAGSIGVLGPVECIDELSKSIVHVSCIDILSACFTGYKLFSAIFFTESCSSHTDMAGYGLPAYALRYEELNVGGTIASSKKKICWYMSFTEEPEEHLVALVHSKLSGKKQIFADGAIVYTTSEVCAAGLAEQQGAATLPYPTLHARAFFPNTGFHV